MGNNRTDEYTVDEIKLALSKLRPFIIEHQHRERIYEYISLYKELHNGEIPSSEVINKFSGFLIDNRTCAIEADKLLQELSADISGKFHKDYSKRRTANLFKQAAIAIMIAVICGSYIGIFLVEHGFEYFDKQLFLNGPILINAIIVFFIAIIYFILSLFKE
ncbi:MAG: hypothetical protein PHO25_11160 [Syntrophomonadaceae bacterium]|nr:hypothetical protein [Syntrophomonadaceae bacterium]